MNLSNNIVIHKNVNGIEFLQFRKLLEYPNIRHGYSLKDLNFRKLGDSDSRYPEYQKFLNALDINPITLVKPDQTHSDNILEIYEKKNIDGPDIYMDYLENVDATITDKKNITLASTNADCILMFFYDEKKNIIANVHSGWKGTFQKISQKTIQKMKKDYGCLSENIIVCICPCIRMCHFEVDTDVESICRKIFEYTNRLDEIIKIGRIVDGKQKYNIDTVLINKILFREEGIKEENIFDSNICSVCSSEKVHSRRTEGIDYRLGSAVIEII